VGNISKYKILSEAKKYFSQSDYKKALEKFATVLQNDPESKEAYNGVILSEMALSGEGGAEALFDYYEILKAEDKESADEIMSDILESMDGTLDKLSEIFMEPFRDRLEFEDGIMYEDFKKILEENNGDFKSVFDRIMFSTKVIISSKNDFLEFLDYLIEYNYNEMALNYLENALSIYPTDSELRNLLKKLAKRLSVETTNT
jgi:tetratricopeptide (TPR) repeat protein